ncbi:MAG: acyltransferase, partial [Candidatus Deferrimicrobiaceae bacterium]
ELERGDYTFRGTWEKFGPLLVQNRGGEILIGDVQFQGPIRIQVDKGARVEIGDYTSINYGVEIHSKVRVTIGRYLLIAWNVSIMDTDYHGVGYNPPKHLPTTLEDGVWVGNGSTILKGVTVGQGAIVAAGSVVIKNVPAFTVVSGNPAKVIKEIEPFEGKHGQMYEYKWWDPSFIPAKPSEIKKAEI